MRLDSKFSITRLEMDGTWQLHTFRDGMTNVTLHAVGGDVNMTYANGGGVGGATGTTTLSTPPSDDEGFLTIDEGMYLNRETDLYANGEVFFYGAAGTFVEIEETAGIIR